MKQAKTIPGAYQHNAKGIRFPCLVAILRRVVPELLSAY